MNRSSAQVISSNERDAERNERNEMLREITSAHSDDGERAEERAAALIRQNRRLQLNKCLQICVPFGSIFPASWQS